MKISLAVGFCMIILGVNTMLQGMIGEMIEKHKVKGTLVITEEEKNFEQITTELAEQLKNVSKISDVSQSTGDQFTQLFCKFFTLFFDPKLIQFCAKSRHAGDMTDFYEQFRTWERKLEDAFKSKTWLIPAFASAPGCGSLKDFIVQALKVICQADRFATYGEERLVIFKLRLWHILESIINMPYFKALKKQLIDENSLLAENTGAFWSWEVDFIKSEFKDSQALKSLFDKLYASVDTQKETAMAAERALYLTEEQQRVKQREAQELQELKNLVAHIKEQEKTLLPLPSSIDSGDSAFGQYCQLYLDCIRVLLDPSCLQLIVGERQQIHGTSMSITVGSEMKKVMSGGIQDTFNKLHDKIGRIFTLLFPQEGPESFYGLQMLVARALDKITSKKGSQGKDSFVNAAKTVLEKLIKLVQHETLNARKQKYRWINLFYMDNGCLPDMLRQRLREIIGNVQPTFEALILMPDVKKCKFEQAPSLVTTSIVQVETNGLKNKLQTLRGKLSQLKGHLDALKQKLVSLKQLL